MATAGAGGKSPRRGSRAGPQAFGGPPGHAAITAGELGTRAVVGCGDATRKLKDGQAGTVSCAEGDTGNIYDGLIPFEVSSRERGVMPKVGVKIAMNVGNPELAFEFAQLPNAGVGQIGRASCRERV